MAPIDSLRTSYHLDDQIEDYLFQIEHTRNDAPYYKIVNLLNSVKTCTRRRLMDAITAEFISADTEAIRHLLDRGKNVGSLSFDWQTVRNLTISTMQYLEAALNSSHAHAIKVKRNANDPFARKISRPKHLVQIVKENKRPFKCSLKNYANMVLGGVASKARTLAVARRARLANLGLTILRGPATIENGSSCNQYADKIFSVSDVDDGYPKLSDLPNGGPPLHPFCSTYLELFFE